MGCQLEEGFVFFDLHELGDLDVCGAVDAVELVADEIDDHEVLRAFFLGGEDVVCIGECDA